MSTNEVLGLSPKRDDRLIHRLRTACGHLDAVACMVENGSSGVQILHQLSAVQAALHEIGVVILEYEISQSAEIVRTSTCVEQRTKATKQVIELYDSLYKIKAKNIVWSK